ncbi:MAG: hypothetical protein KatS3mg087_0540 [Patescibacteria group bacterium]|nr:MAG: hypothetical protein KatS3mg087_0540 [Patescibacteria group bacterium]
MAIVPFKNDGIEVYIDNATGESYCSVNGYSRMSQKAVSTISERCKGVRECGIKTAQVQTAKGLQSIRLVSEDLIAEWLPKDNPSMTTKLLKLGVRLFLHELAGYKFQAPKPPASLPMSQETQAQLAMKLFECAKLTGSDRALITAQSSMMNMLMPANMPAEVTEELLSVTEICERYGIAVPHGKDSVLGRKVAKAWRDETGTEPKVTSKHVGTGHHAAEIKVYPQEFVERIVAIAQEYLN